MADEQPLENDSENILNETFKILFDSKFQQALLDSRESYNQYLLNNFSPAETENVQTENVPAPANVPSPTPSVSTYIPPSPTPSNSTYVASSLQARHNWPGKYNFNISFPCEPKNTKGVSWTYSDIMDKLYICKDKPCPVNFSTSEPMVDGVVIRASLQYTLSQHSGERVKRCHNHAVEDIIAGIPQAEHLVRSDSNLALYEVNTINDLSVVIPFDNPQEGEPYSTYIYRFACFQSCSGGPNRRPLTLVFSLENGEEVIGRRVLDLKICACPGRDRKTDEKRPETEQKPLPKKRERETSFINLSDVFDFTKDIEIPVPKKMREALPDSEGVYTITTRDPECYRFLCGMIGLYDRCHNAKQLDRMTSE